MGEGQRGQASEPMTGPASGKACRQSWKGNRLPHELPAAVGRDGARICPAGLVTLTTAVLLARYLASSCSCSFPFSSSEP